MFLTSCYIDNGISPHYYGLFLLNVYNANQYGALAPAF